MWSRRSESVRAKLRPRVLGRTAVSSCGPGAAGGGSGDSESVSGVLGAAGWDDGEGRGLGVSGTRRQQAARGKARGRARGGGLGGAEGLRSAWTWDGELRQAGPPALPACAKGVPAASGAAGAADAEKQRTLRVGW